MAVHFRLMAACTSRCTAHTTAGKRMVHPDSSLFSVAASALYGIILAAQEQYADSLFRVNEMRL